jgi:hypothetical protein
MEAVEGNRVLEHTLMRNKVLDGDNYVLHVQVSSSGPGSCLHFLVVLHVCRASTLLDAARTSKQHQKPELYAVVI